MPNKNSDLHLVQWKMDIEGFSYGNPSAAGVGSLFVVASPRGLKSIGWQDKNVALLDSLESSAPEVRILAQTEKQLREYFSGSRKNFDLPLDVIGTDFQMKVWKELQKIPYARTCSYLDIARKIKNEKAVRAVGAANGKNPLSIIVPCHRVIGANGALTGYVGGLTTKTQLLALEKNNTNKSEETTHDQP